jgi:hypothetical protein
MVDEKGERLASRPLHHVNLIAHSFDLPSGRSTKSWDATLAIEARLGGRWSRGDSVYKHDVWMTTGAGAPHNREGPQAH